MSTLGKTATHSDRGVPMAQSTWLRREEMAGATASPPAFLSPWCQVEHRGHHVHPAGGLPALLAPETDADAEDDHEWQLPVRLA